MDETTHQRVARIMRSVIAHHFPELDQIDIQLVGKPLSFSYASRPSLCTLFRQPHARNYLVLYNTSPKNGRPSLLPQNLSDEALAGILAHELSHTVYYLGKSWFAMLAFAVLYFVPTFRRRIERQTDQEAINRGFRPQLLAFRRHMVTTLEPRKMRYIERFYYSADEIAAANAGDACEGPAWLESCLCTCKKNEQMLSFAVVTGIGNLIDIVLFYGLYDLLGWNVWLANVLAFGTSVVFNFFVSRTVSFAGGHEKTATRFGKYTLTSIGSYVVDTLATLFFLGLGMVSPLAKLFAGWVTFLWSYSINKWWTFRD